MKSNRLKLGDKLELEIDNEFYNISQPLVSQFETLLPDGTMQILSPIYKGRVLYIGRNTKMNVIYEQNNDLFSFKAIAHESKYVGGLAMLRIEQISEEERLQRRNFFRLRCVLDIEYRLFEEKNTPAEERGEFKKSITRDISGGGICLFSREKIDAGTYIEGKIQLDQEICFIGIVRRVIPADRGDYKYAAGIEYIDIADKEREKVISFIFDYQRKLLKKGWYYN
ncbi:MAG: flagellar brake protein [Clostridiaceae bacterium]|nr:flagellar brake protein [Clostridiaceae bacterium]